MNMKRVKLDPNVEMRKPRRASRIVSTYGKFVQKREYDYHLPPSGSELVGDLEVWEVLLMDGKPSAEHSTAFHFGKKLLHQPTFLDGQMVHGKPVCCVWDVNTGDVYYRGPEGPPLDLEKVAKRKEARILAQEEALRAAEERRSKMDELEAKMRAEVEMRAKLDAEAKLKLERQGLLKQEMLEAARAEIEARVRGTGDLPSLVPRTVAEVKASLSQAKAPPTEPAPSPRPSPSPRESSKPPDRHFSKSPRRPAKEEEAKPKSATAVDPTQEAQKEQPEEAGAERRQSGRRHDVRPPPEVEAAAAKTTEEEELDQVRLITVCVYFSPFHLIVLPSTRSLQFTRNVCHPFVAMYSERLLLCCRKLLVWRRRRQRSGLLNSSPGSRRQRLRQKKQRQRHRRKRKLRRMSLLQGRRRASRRASPPSLLAGMSAQRARSALRRRERKSWFRHWGGNLWCRTVSSGRGSERRQVGESRGLHGWGNSAWSARYLGRWEKSRLIMEVESIKFCR